MLDAVRRFGKMEEQLDPVTRRSALSHFPNRQQRLVKKQIRVIPRPVPSTHLAPCEFWHFPSLEMGLSGHRFISVGEIQLKSTAGACSSGRTVGRACACVRACVRACRVPGLRFILYVYSLLQIMPEFRNVSKRRVNTVLHINHWKSPFYVSVMARQL